MIRLARCKNCGARTTRSGAVGAWCGKCKNTDAYRAEVHWLCNDAIACARGSIERAMAVGNVQAAVIGAHASLWHAAGLLSEDHIEELIADGDIHLDPQKLPTIPTCCPDDRDDYIAAIVGLLADDAADRATALLEDGWTVEQVRADQLARLVPALTEAVVFAIDLAEVASG